MSCRRRRPSLIVWLRPGGPSCGARMVTPMLTVAGDRDLVERQLAGGLLVCPECGTGVGGGGWVGARVGGGVGGAPGGGEGGGGGAWLGAFPVAAPRGRAGGAAEGARDRAGEGVRDGRRRASPRQVQGAGVRGDACAGAAAGAVPAAG